jgi:hypothetical protein
MAAHEYLQGEQLSMFMPAHALMEYPSGESASRSSLSVDTGLHENKLWESKQRGLVEEIRGRGVEKPVLVMIRKQHEDPWEYQHQILDGHHRVVSANNVNPNMEIPVKHSSAKYY